MKYLARRKRGRESTRCVLHMVTEVTSKHFWITDNIHWLLPVVGYMIIDAHACILHYPFHLCRKELPLNIIYMYQATKIAHIHVAAWAESHRQCQCVVDDLNSKELICTIMCVLPWSWFRSIGIERHERWWKDCILQTIISCLITHNLFFKFFW